MTDIGTLAVSMGLDISDLRKDVRTVKSELNSMAGTTEKQLDRVDKSVKKTGTAFNGFIKTVKSAALGYATVLATMKIVDFTSGIVQQGAALDSLQRSYKTITGSTALANKELKFINKTAQDLGLSLTVLEDAYKNIYAASKNTSLEGAEIQRIFHSVTKASAVLGMSADDTSGSLRALSQMISKGNVQAEELRGQLGERLPGAFQMAAEAMGVSTQGLNKMLEQGQVLASDLLPKLADVLENRFGDAAKDAGDRARASFEHFGKSIVTIQRAIADSGILDFFAKLAEASSKVLNLLSEGIRGKSLERQMESIKAKINEIENAEQIHAENQKKRQQEYVKEQLRIYNVIREHADVTIVLPEKSISVLEKLKNEYSILLSDLMSFEIEDRTLVFQKGLVSSLQKVKNLHQAMKDLNVIEPIDADKRTEAFIDLSNKIKKITLSTYEYEKALIEKTAFDFKKSGLKEIEIKKWVNLALEKLDKEEAERIKKLFDDSQIEVIRAAKAKAKVIAEIEDELNKLTMTEKKYKLLKLKQEFDARAVAAGVYSDALQKVYDIQKSLIEQKFMDIPWDADYSDWESDEARIQREAAAVRQAYEDRVQAEKDLTATELKEKEQREKDLEDSLEKQQAAHEHMYNEVHDIAADFYGDVLNGNADLLDSLYSVFKKTLAQIAADLTTPLFLNIVQSVTGGITGSIGNSIGSSLLGGGSSGGGLTDLFSDIKNIGDFGNSIWTSASAMTAMAQGGATQGMLYPGAISGAVPEAFSGVGNLGALGNIGSIAGGITLAGIGLIAGKIFSKISEPATPRFGFMGSEFVGAEGNVNKIDQTPYTKVLGLPNKYESENYDYSIFASEFQGQDKEIRETLLTYFDTVFANLDAVTESSINDVLKEYSHLSAGGFVGDVDFETSFANVSKDVFSGLLGGLLVSILPDAGTIDKTVQELVDKESSTVREVEEAVAALTMTSRGLFESNNNGLSGIGAFNQANSDTFYSKPIYEDVTHQVSKLADTFNDAFFDALIPEEGNEWDAFVRFASVVKESDDFMAGFNRQIDKFSKSTLSAFLNMETITAILVETGAAVDALATPDMSRTLNESVILWDALILKLNEANATILDVTQAERDRNTVIGASLTGITGTTLMGAIASGQDPNEIIMSSIKNMLSGRLSTKIMDDIINPINEKYGEAYINDPDNLSALIGIIQSTDLLAAQQEIQEFYDWLETDLFAGLTTGVEDLVTAETALSDARTNALESIDDLIRELEGGSLAPVQSMEYFQSQYDNSMNALTSATTPEQLESAIDNLVSSAPDYLDFAQDYGGNYKNSYDDVLETLRDINIDQNQSGDDVTVNVTIGEIPIEDILVRIIRTSKTIGTALRRFVH